MSGFHPAVTAPAPDGAQKPTRMSKAPASLSVPTILRQPRLIWRDITRRMCRSPTASTLISAARHWPSLMLPPAQFCCLRPREGRRTSLILLNDVGAVSGTYASPSGNGGDSATLVGYLDWTKNAKYVCGASATVGMGNPPRADTGGGTSPYVLAPVHTGAANFAFTDGHVKYTRGIQISAGRSATVSTDNQDTAFVGEAAGTSNLNANNFVGTFSYN